MRGFRREEMWHMTGSMPYQPRTYRRHIRAEGLTSFGVRVGETDIRVAAEFGPETVTTEVTVPFVQRLARSARAELHAWRRRYPAFFETLEPLRGPLPDKAPEIVRVMARAGELAGVGPMAAVAGAIAERVGRGMIAGAPGIPPAREVIVENGGDIFMASRSSRRVAIFAGESPLSLKLAVEIAPEETPLGVATSSATVGPSVNFGAADAAVVIAADAALADAAATALGNRVRSRGDLGPALEWVLRVEGVRGALVILGDAFAAQGLIRIAPGPDAA